MTRLEKTVAFFRESAENDWKVAEKLFQSKEYAYALFFCHLALEKLIKSIIVKKTDRAAPFIHDLVKLAKFADIELDKVTENSLEKITDFHIAGRYDDEKLLFRKKCTKPFTEKYLKISGELYLWLKNNYPKRS